MDERSLIQLISYTPYSRETIQQFRKLVKGASKAEKQKLAQTAVDRSWLPGDVSSPVNGFVLYVLCLNHKDVSIDLMQEHWRKVEYAVHGNWTMSIEKLSEKKVFGPEIRKLALRVYKNFVERTQQP